MSNLHNDHPATIDLLNRDRLKALLFDQISKPDKLPLVFGVHGDWGAGKTSFLQQLQTDLDNEVKAPHVVTVWFEAWRYQHESAPVIALLQEIRQQLSTHKKLLSKVSTLSDELPLLPRTRS
ncbi:MAG: P-loop NTPase fold protein [Pseudomonadota bacterium]